MRIVLIIFGVILGCVLGFCSFILLTRWMGTITIDASQISILPLVLFLPISMSVLFGGRSSYQTQTAQYSAGEVEVVRVAFPN